MLGLQRRRVANPMHADGYYSGECIATASCPAVSEDEPGQLHWLPHAIIAWLSGPTRWLSALMLSGVVFSEAVKMTEAV